MGRGKRQDRSALLLAAAFALGLCALGAACSAEGETPTCPQMTLYDVRGHEAGTDAAAAVDRARAEAVAQGCATQLGDATSGRVP
jgi:hypothetical protein